ncbi:MAG: hypothetical protein ACFFBD_24570, partial [Candidatus Hodarchaeota archaeon]
MSVDLEKLSLESFQRFFRPRTFLEKAFLLITLIWVFIAFVQPDIFLRSLSFSLLLGNLFLLAIERVVVFARENILWEKNVFFPIATRTFLIYIPILLIAAKVPNMSFFFFDIPVTFWELERDILALVFLGATVLRSVDMGVLIKFRDPLNFLLKSLRGVWLSSLALLVITSLGYFAFIQSNSIFFSLVERPMLEYIVFGGLCANIISSVRPLGKRSTIEKEDLWNRFKGTVFERVRDGVIGSFLVLVVLVFVGWLGVAGIIFWGGLTSRDVWLYTIFILLIGGILLFLPNRKVKSQVSASSVVSSAFKMLDPRIQENVSQLDGFIQNLKTDSMEEVYSLPTDKNLLSQGGTEFKAKEGTIAIPVPSESPDESTAIVFVGKGELKTKDQVTEVDGPTTIVFSNNEWQQLKETFVPENWQQLLQRVSASLPTLIQTAIEQIKKWSGPEQLFLQLDKMVAGASGRGKYFIQEGKEGTRVSLPGFRMFEDRNMTLVKFPFFQLVEVKGVCEYVRFPFFQIIDTKK